MRKAIRLAVVLWVEGEEAPAHDFLASTSAAVRDILASGAAAHRELAITVQSIQEAEEE